MTIATGSPIIAQDVIDAINANYPDFANLIPSPFQGQPFIAGVTSTIFEGYVSDSPSSQSLATAIALLSLGLPVRSVDPVQDDSGLWYEWQGDYLLSGEVTGSLVRAASSWQTAQATGPDPGTAYASALATLPAGSLAIMASLYSGMAPFYGYSSVTYQPHGQNASVTTWTFTPSILTQSATFTNDYLIGVTDYDTSCSLTFNDMGSSPWTATWIASTTGPNSVGDNPDTQTGLAGNPFTSTWSGFTGLSPSDAVIATSGAQINGPPYWLVIIQTAYH